LFLCFIENNFTFLFINISLKMRKN